jgi:hypothetical protein
VTHHIGQEVQINGIVWRIEGGRGPVWRMSHRCQRFTIQPGPAGPVLVAKTVRIETHKKLEET